MAARIEANPDWLARDLGEDYGIVNPPTFSSVNRNPPPLVLVAVDTCRVPDFRKSEVHTPIDAPLNGGR